MPDRDNASPLQAPFDQGVFLLHYNRGRAAFQEARFAEARRELENAQKLRPDDAEQFLLRSVELRPNYAKSHLYLGLLYRARRKYNLAIEHLKFANADKLVREVENEVKQIVNAPFSSSSSPAKSSSDVTTAKIPAMNIDAKTQPAAPRPRTDADRTLVPGRTPTPLPARIPVPPTAGSGAAH